MSADKTSVVTSARACIGPSLARAGSLPLRRWISITARGRRPGALECDAIAGGGAMAEQLDAPAVTQAEIDQRVFDLYDEYCHGRLDRREFLQRAGALTI